MKKIILKYYKELSELMFILVPLIFYSFKTFGKILVEIFKINSSTGWWLSDETNIIQTIPYFSFLGFTIVYLLLKIFKKKTQPFLSFLHLITIGISSFLFNFWLIDLKIILFIFMLSLFIFFLNVYYSIKLKQPI